jgi:hypothetical protein
MDESYVGPLRPVVMSLTFHYVSKGDADGPEPTFLAIQPCLDPMR